MCLKAGTTLMHVARGTAPSDAKITMQWISEVQTRLFRRCTTVSAEDLPDTHGPCCETPPTPARCDLSMSLPALFGGFGWTHPLHMMGPASAGRVIEVLPWLRDLPELASRIPPPSQWATCKMGALRDAHGFITRLTSSG